MSENEENKKSIDQNGVIGNLRSSVNDILGLRDSLGVALSPVYLVKRNWSGEEIGEGQAQDSQEQVLPSPRIFSMSDDSRIVAGGAVQIDDLLIKGISKVNYPKKNLIDGTSESETIECFYLVDGFIYTVTNVTEKHLTWNVQIRKLSNQKRY